MDSEPTERDPAGNLNNVYTVPQKPAANGQANLKEEPKGSTLSGKHTLILLILSKYPDLAATIVAADGTSSAFQYVTSSVGGAIKGDTSFDAYLWSDFSTGVIGVDPWSPVKVISNNLHKTQIHQSHRLVLKVHNQTRTSTYLRFRNLRRLPKNPLFHPSFL